MTGDGRPCLRGRCCTVAGGLGGGGPLPCTSPSQILPDSQEAARDACNGIQADGSRVGFGRTIDILGPDVFNCGPSSARGMGEVHAGPVVHIPCPVANRPHGGRNVWRRGRKPRGRLNADLVRYLVPRVSICCFCIQAKKAPSRVPARVIFYGRLFSRVLLVARRQRTIQVLPTRELPDILRVSEGKRQMRSRA
jgi:hypothetical protein